MASPVAVIPTPDSPTTHMLFFLNGYKQQLAMEVRSTKDTKNYLPFHDNGVPKGVIVNPSSLSAVLSNGISTVYGITQPGGDHTAYYISTVSPFYNLLAEGDGVQTTSSAVAACSDPATGTDYVYYLQQPKGQSDYRIVEFCVDGTHTTPGPPWSKTNPSNDTNLAAVYYQQTRFVIYANTDDKHLIYWANSDDQTPNPIKGTEDVAVASPVAVTSVSSLVLPGSLDVYLYYMNLDRRLTRVVGKLRGSSIKWHESNVVDGAPLLLDSTLMAATTTGLYNYVYYIPEGKAEFEPYKEIATPLKSRNTEEEG